MQQDDLFNENYVGKQEEFVVRKDNPNDLRSEGRVNLIILAVYILLLLLSSFFDNAIKSNHKANTKDLVEHSLIWTVTEVDDVFVINYKGEITNTTNQDIGLFYILFDLNDASGNLIVQKAYKVESLPANATIEINEDYDVDEMVVSIDENTYHPIKPHLLNTINFVPTLIIALALFYVNRKNYKEDFLIFKKAPKRHIKYIFSGFVLVYVALFMANAIMDFLGVSGTSQNELAIQSMFNLDAISIITLFLSLVIFTPIVEETVFRKSIYGLVKPSMGDIAAILISGLIFAFLHVAGFGDFIQVIPYAFMGLSFSYIYYYTNRNLYVVIVIHAMNNLIPYLFYTFGLLN